MARFELPNGQRIEPDQPAEGAVRVILAVLLADLRLNVPGTIEGHDPECLHDLRVAARRTRSLLSQLKKVLPKEEARHFAKEFRWLGKLTGPCRDLDVWTLERQDQRARQPISEAAVLDPLDNKIAERRAAAHAAVIEGLRSDRFINLLADWDAFLHNPAVPTKELKNAGRAAKGVAGDRIFKAYRRVVRRGGELDTDSPAAEIHRLRIDAKKLRYLLECFRSIYAEAIVETQVGKLKKLQDALGGFNDTVVQQKYLAELRGELENEVAAATLRAIDQLAVDIADRQQGFRHDLFERFRPFCDQATKSEFADLFEG